MKHTFKKLFAILLCASLCITAVLPIAAVNEDNTLGVTFYLELDKTEVVNDADTTITATLKASQPIVVDGVSFTFSSTPALTITSFGNGDGVDSSDPTAVGITYAAADYNTATGYVGWSSPSMENYENVTTLGSATFSVPAGTAAGVYTIDATKLEFTKDYGEPWEESAEASITFEVKAAGGDDDDDEVVVPTDAPVVTADKDSIMVGETLNVAVEPNIAFAAIEMNVSYDPEFLSYAGGGEIYGATVEDNATTGTLQIVRYGTDLTADDAFTLVFTGKKNTAGATTPVTLTYIATSESADAPKKDLVELTPATGFDSVEVEVEKTGFTVELPAGFDGLLEVPNGAEKYEFVALDPYYTYELTATMGGQTVTVNGNEKDGFYITGPIDGDIVITEAKRTAKTFTVTFEATGNWDNYAGTKPSGTAVATYNTDYTYTIPTDAYSTITATVAGVTSTTEAGVIKVLGKDVIADFTITVNRALDGVNIYVASGDSSEVDLSTTPVAGNDYTFPITKDPLYTYAVSAVDADGNPVTVTDNGDDTYTIAGEDVVGTIALTVVKTLDTTDFATAQYVQLNDEKEAYLVLMPAAAKIADRKYTYDGADMFWSEDYKAYVTVVIATDATGLTDDKLNVAAGAATNVDYGMDVNKTGVIDANDAQLVDNIYLADYSDFTVATVEMFLRADVDLNKTVNTDDAEDIVAWIIANK